ncbi:MAG: hypothetical protein ACPGWR_17155 [Ardenticatenaceae bacterium]
MTKHGVAKDFEVPVKGTVGGLIVVLVCKPLLQKMSAGERLDGAVNGEGVASALIDPSQISTPSKNMRIRMV